MEQLKKNCASRKFPHAVIFSGLEGIGKRKIAEVCAVSLLCENLIDGEPCGTCPNCKLFKGKSHPDFYVVEPEETKTARIIKIGQIRDLQSQVSLRPIQAERRIILIDGAEFMRKEAANCLLKTLEEPASQTIFILITANRAGLLMTVRSRCVTFNFERLTLEEIKSELLRREIDIEKAEELSVIAGGSLGRALKLSESGGYELRETALDLLERIFRGEISNEDIFTKGMQISDWKKEQFADFIVYVQKILRDISLLGQIELYNSDIEARLGKIKISESSLSEMLKIGEDIYKRLRSNANLRLLAESYFFRLRIAMSNNF